MWIDQQEAGKVGQPMSGPLIVMALILIFWSFAFVFSLCPSSSAPKFIRCCPDLQHRASAVLMLGSYFAPGFTALQVRDRLAELQAA